MEKTILLIDDDRKLTELLTEYLTSFGYPVVSAERPSEGLALLETKEPSVVILDVMLPEQNGFEVCKTIRRSSQVPVIMLTARGDVADKVVGLELGADDDLRKPFEPRELLARVQSVLRRTQRAFDPKQLDFGDLKIDLDRHQAILRGTPVELSTNEYAVLVFLASNAGRTMTRDEILDHLKGVECEAFNRSVDVLISRLRQKLGDDPKNPSFFKTVWGTGYLFLGGHREKA